MTPAEPKKSLTERLTDGPVICAEGYLFELERRGYLQAGAYVPEVVIEHPELVAELHREFVHAGSDVVEAFTYYAHREKLRIVGREDDFERINRQALQIAEGVASEHGSLFAGNICNTNIYDPADATTHKAVRGMFEEQVAWAIDANVDFTRRDQEGGEAGRHHAGGASRASNARWLERGRGLQAYGERGLRCRRPQLYSRTAHHNAAVA
jgi:betaine-homocysteine S-methyltransferase